MRRSLTNCVVEATFGPVDERLRNDVEETIIVQFPGESAQLMNHQPPPGAGDDDIAKQLSHRFRAGTMLTIDGAKWRVEGPNNVTLVYDPIDGLYPKGHSKPAEPAVKPKRRFEEMAEKAGELPTGLLACMSPPLDIKPGDRWKPKDPRRKSSFTVVKILDGEVYTDDGRTIQLSRMSRYERVSR